MNYKSTLLLSLAIPALYLAAKPADGGVYVLMLDRLLAAVRSQSPTSGIALDMLERVVLGQTESISDESVAQFGLKPGDLKQKVFKTPLIRQVAVWEIGETGLPEAEAFLSKLKLTDFPDDRTLGIWGTTKVAIRNAALVRITDPQEKVEYLKSVLTENNYAASHGGTGVWAVDELCNAGASAALPEIQESIRRRGSGRRDEDAIELCKARIQVVSRNPERAKALATVLRLDGPPEDYPLVGWAVNQLISMHSADADAELSRFAVAVDGLPRNSAARLIFQPYRAGIQSTPAQSPR